MKITILAAVPILLAAGASLAAWKNLQILPSDLPEADLMATMTRIKDALGVECTHCHVSTDDFAADDKPAKATARRMMRMTIALNRDYFPGQDAPLITCVTCHRGALKPETLPRRGPRPLPEPPPAEPGPTPTE